MKVFLTGAAGYVGSAVARALVRAGHRVAALTRSAENARRLAAFGAEPVIGDFEKPMSFMAAAQDAEALVHAGLDRGPRGARNDNLAVETLLACACRGSARRLIYTSGVWVLGPSRGAPADEAAEPRPPRVVEWRPAVEKTVLRAAKGGFSTVVLRPGCVYGERQGLFGRMIASLLEDRRIRLIDGGRNRWASVYLDDLAELYRIVLERPPSSGVYHAADGGAETVRETAKALIDAAGGGSIEDVPMSRAEAELGPFAEALAMDQLVSSSRAGAELGWKPKVVSAAAHARCLLEEWHEAAQTPLSVV